LKFVGVTNNVHSPKKPTFHTPPLGDSAAIVYCMYLLCLVDTYTTEYLFNSVRKSIDVNKI
jgi:hypothetical protein